MSSSKSKKVIQPVNAKDIFDVIEIDKQTFHGVNPLRKPSKEIRGVFGGNIVAQCVVVAMRSAPGYTPNSIHSHFVKAVNEESALVWKVEHMSNGKSFATRRILGLQNKVVVFSAMVSLTTKNSTSKSGHKNSTQMEYYPSPGKTAFTRDFKNPVHNPFPPLSNYHRSFKHQKEKHRFAFQIRWGVKDDPDWHEELQNVTTEYKFAGLAMLSDWTQTERVFPHVGIKVVPSFEASLDHNVYFHEDDFDIDQWFSYVASVKWIANDRSLIKADMYTEDNRHVATIVQEMLCITSSKL
ncbi:hypothetical protein I9W82_002116 [Candida metapsilosis]|uniref:Uncharacterized protein n=1 Tax=Candida metapsilosis TaxID=273372 RepID=A0A8H7ZHS6_9ASCO|nr:hypothetical protein I9W82_002116 [Candida metapsilosis]